MNNKIARLAFRIGNSLLPFAYSMLSFLGKGLLLRGGYVYVRNALAYSRAAKRLGGSFSFNFKAVNIYPCLYDRFEQAGSVPKHYFFQDIWAARKVAASGVSMHYDVGSRLDGFIAHCLSFCSVVMLDVRPLKIDLKGLLFTQANCMSMTNISDGQITSISSLHAIEHFGLGRYGDPIDVEGHVKAINELKRVLSVGGDLYFSVPVGLERIEFDAHRIFSPKTIISLFSGLELVEFSAVDDSNGFCEHADISSYESADYSCGLFHFRKTS